jgi:hypothetical protein
MEDTEERIQKGGYRKQGTRGRMQGRIQERGYTKDEGYRKCGYGRGWRTRVRRIQMKDTVWTIQEEGYSREDTGGRIQEGGCRREDTGGRIRREDTGGRREEEGGGRREKEEKDERKEEEEIRRR